MTENETPRPSARDQVRKSRRSRTVPDTGRMHHMGAAPTAVPVHTEAGVEITRATSWQLADRTVPQLEVQRSESGAAMARAAEDLDFESAARWRDELVAVEAELARRSSPQQG